MSYLLESLGRGLLTRVGDAFNRHLPDVSGDTISDLKTRQEYSNTSVDLLLRLGTCYWRDMRLSEARKAFQEAQELSTDARLPAIGLACVEDELARHERTLEHLSRAQEADPYDAAIMFAIGFVHERSGARLAAASAYQRALEMNPSLKNGYERLAAMALYRGDTQRAAEYYGQLSESDCESFEVYLAHAAFLRSAGESQPAESRFQRTLLIEPPHEDTQEDIEQLVATGALGAAIDNIGQLVQEYPGVPDYHVQLGDLYVKAGSREEAIEQYQIALDYQPDMLEASIKLGTQQLRARKFEQAAHGFSHALTLNDRLIAAFVGLGLSQRDQGKDADADATFRLAASLDANSVLLFAETARIGEIQADEQKNAGFEPWAESDTATEERSNHALIAEALRRHEQAVRVHPNHAGLCYHYGLLLRFMGRDWEAQQAFSHAVAIDANFALAHIRLGVGHLAIGDMRQAIQAFERSFRIDLDAIRVRYELAMLFSQRSIFDMAMDQFGLHEMQSGVDQVTLQANLSLSLQQVGLLDRTSLTWRSIQNLRSQNLDVSANREKAVGNQE